MTEVHVVLPNDIDDPATPSGGNVYDRRVCAGLAAAGWSVREHAARGAWPRPTAADRADLAQTLSAVPDGALVLLDGLVASAVPDVLVPQAGRLQLVVLVHLPLENDAEGAALATAWAIVATSRWTRRRLLDRYPLAAARIHVAPPGVDPAPVAPGSAAGDRLLCVAPVTPHKGHDLLAEGLAKVADLPWRCVCAGSLDRDPGFVEQLRRQLDEYGLTDRVQLAGPRTRAGLDAAYADADLLVLPSRGETYGMVVTEALARGIPVLATAVGGLPDALGHAPDGSRPGILVPPDDPAALAGALRRWLGDAELRARLRHSALGRRDTLTDWSVTAELVSNALRGVIPRVTPGWLALREPADAAARAEDLVGPVRRHLAAAAPAVIHDLGTGTGSMGRWLAPRLPGPQHWIMYDRDADLLVHAEAGMAGMAGMAGRVSVETRQRDITRLTARDLAGAGLVTASALLDMLTRDEVERVVAACAGAGCPALFTVSVVGRVELTPSEPLDTEIEAAFNAHQRRTAGGRTLLGPDAVEATVEAFERRGVGVLVRSSPWRLGADQAALAAAWFTGWVAAACEQRPELGRPAAGYARRRLAEAAAGRLAVVVEHTDLLAGLE